MDKIYLVKFNLSETMQSCYFVKEYKVQKITDKRIYFYKIFDKETDDSDVSYIPLDNMCICKIKHFQSGLIEIYMWCDEEHLEMAQDKLKKNLQLNLETRIRKIYTDTKEVFGSTIKI